LNDYLMWRTARTRAAELRAEAREAHLAGALRRTRGGSWRYLARVGGLLGGLSTARGPVQEAGEVCCA
jgi:hypothetical protein